MKQILLLLFVVCTYLGHAQEKQEITAPDKITEGWYMVFDKKLYSVPLSYTRNAPPGTKYAFYKKAEGQIIVYVKKNRYSSEIIKITYIGDIINAERVVPMADFFNRIWLPE